MKMNLSIYKINAVSSVIISMTGMALLGSVGAQDTPNYICKKVQDFKSQGFIMESSKRLFVKPEFESYYPINEVDRQYLQEWQDLIKSLHINLIIVPIPYKASLYINDSNNPSRQYNAKLARDRYNDYISQMRNLGFNVISPQEAQGNSKDFSNFFALHDHHWTGEAIKAAAGEVATAIKKMRLGLSGNLVTTLSTKRRGYAGSIAQELHKACGYDFPQEEQRTFFDLKVNGGETLLGASSEDVVVLGDSYGFTYFGFPQVLSDDLKTGVTDDTINGGGCCSSVTKYFSNLTPSEPKPKVLVWVALEPRMNSDYVREYIPATYKAYKNPMLVFSAIVISKENLVIPTNLTLFPKGRYFLEIKTDKGNLQRSEIKINYDQKSEDKSFNNLPKPNEKGESIAFYELMSGASFLKSVKIKTDGGMPLTVSIFRYK